LIIEVLTGERAFDEIHLRDGKWFEEKNITLITGDPAANIDVPGNLVTLESGHPIEYEKLLIAVGSIPRTPPIRGLEDIQFINLYRQDDIEQLKPLCKEGSRALVIGLGLIGMQAIMALKGLGVSVIGMELVDKVLPLILDKNASKYIQQRIEDNGISIHTGSAVEELSRIAGEDHPYLAVTGSGMETSFDFLVLAVGMKPDLSILKGSGIETGRGIKVSRNMETSVSGIYAAGDVVEYQNWIEGQHEVHAHWVNAYRQGRIAGLSMAGTSAEPYTPVYLNSLSVFGLPIITMGASRIDDTKGAEVFITETPARESYTRFVVKDGRLIAATFINDVDRAGVLQYLMQEKIEVGDVAGSLFEEGKEGLEFLDKLHADVVRGDVEWASSMDLIEKYRKDMKHTRWGGGKGSE